MKTTMKEVPTGFKLFSKMSIANAFCFSKTNCHNFLSSDTIKSNVGKLPHTREALSDASIVCWEVPPRDALPHDEAFGESFFGCRYFVL